MGTEFGTRRMLSAPNETLAEIHVLSEDEVGFTSGKDKAGVMSNERGVEQIDDVRKSKCDIERNEKNCSGSFQEK